MSVKSYLQKTISKDLPSLDNTEYKSRCIMEEISKATPRSISDTSTVRRGIMDYYRGDKDLEYNKHGFGIYEYANQFYRYEGQWKNGKKHGKGKLIMADKTTYCGTFRDGEIDGYGTKIWPDGETVYRGHFSHGVQENQGEMKYRDGSVYIGTFHNNQRSGQGILKDKTGVYRGSFKDNKRCGEGTQTFKEGHVYKGSFEDNVIQGQGEFTYKLDHKKSIIIRGLFANGKPPGFPTKLRLGEKTRNLDGNIIRIVQGDPLSISVELINQDGKVVRSLWNFSLSVKAWYKQPKLSPTQCAALQDAEGSETLESVQQAVHSLGVEEFTFDGKPVRGVPMPLAMWRHYLLSLDYPLNLVEEASIRTRRKDVVLKSILNVLKIDYVRLRQTEFRHAMNGNGKDVVNTEDLERRNLMPTNTLQQIDEEDSVDSISNKSAQLVCEKRLSYLNDNSLMKAEERSRKISQIKMEALTDPKEIRRVEMLEECSDSILSAVDFQELPDNFDRKAFPPPPVSSFVYNPLVGEASLCHMAFPGTRDESGDYAYTPYQVEALKMKVSGKKAKVQEQSAAVISFGGPRAASKKIKMRIPEEKLTPSKFRGLYKEEIDMPVEDQLKRIVARNYGLPGTYILQIEPCAPMEFYQWFQQEPPEPLLIKCIVEPHPYTYFTKRPKSG